MGFGHLTFKNHGICSGFCFSPRKNTVNNSNFAVFSCFSLFFELRWSAIHGYQILRVFFSDNQYFRMFLVSMADIIGSYERSRRCNDAVRAVAVAKRREYLVHGRYSVKSKLQTTTCPFTIVPRRNRLVHRRYLVKSKLCNVTDLSALYQVGFSHPLSMRGQSNT